MNSINDPNRMLLYRIADIASAVKASDLTAHGTDLVKVAIVDTLAVGIAGGTEEAPRVAARAISGSMGAGDCLVLGTASRSNSLDAALLNGIASHILDFDDGNIVQGGHPSTILVPALLALAEEDNSDSRSLIAAYAAGYEVIIRLSRILNPHHYNKGWHPTSTLGVFGAAAGASRLLQLSSEQTATALALAASMASGLKGNFGTMAKSLHAGHAARNGLLCARLAAEGYTANVDVGEAAQGFVNVYQGLDTADIEGGLIDLGNVLEANREINPIKAFPCCASTHRSILSAIDIRNRRDFTLTDISDIEAVLTPARIPHTDRAEISSAIAGKFSQQYVIARALRDGHVGVRDFEGNAHLDDGIEKLMSRVRLVKASENDLPDPFAATLNVSFADGTRLSSTKGGAGRETPTETWCTDQLWAKFADCTSGLLPVSQGVEVRKLLDAFPGGIGVRSFTKLLETSSQLEVAS